MAESLPEKFGRFRVVSELGRGAMGVVYRAEDTTLGRTVAIKTIALSGGSRQERDVHEARFLQEARAAGGISHPVIITIYEMGREGDTAFIAMELLEGRELRELIRDGRLDPARAVVIAATVAEALGYAHERGVVHRDIKPGNIMVLTDGRVKIMDFGIARHREPTVKTQTGVLLGSPQYMAPEQIVGQPFDHRADIFSLGLVLYESLTGVKPFTADDIPDLTFKVANMPATPPSHIAPGLPPVLDYIMARALQKKPEERYQTAAEFARDLRSALPEVEAAQAAAVERTASGTVPEGAADFELAATLPDTTRAREQPLELRPSPRFDSARGLARLSVLPGSDDASRSRAGWAVTSARTPRRVDRVKLATVAAFGIAMMAAIVIVLA
jgi:serine/threonine protein kinase